MNKIRFGQIAVLGTLAVVILWLVMPIIQGVLLSETKSRLVAPRGDLASFETTATQVFEAAAPSVVYIFTERSGGSIFGSRQTQQGTGSGFVWDRAGHVITNQHVVEGAQRIFVRFDTGASSEASYVGGSQDHDLAVLRVRRPPVALTPIPIGSSGELKIGQSVFAIGNPFGLSRTLTTGIISALDRRLPTQTGREITGVIQTDAAINPGNSGGPLIDSAGRLVGVNTAIISNTGSYSGIGFAVPVDTVNRIVPQIIRNGKPARPGIGIQVGSDELAARLNIDGVIVIGVRQGGPADRAGLKGVDQAAQQLGDVITEVNGKRVRTTSELISALETFGVGTEIQLTVKSGNDQRQVSVTLADIA